MGRSQTFPPGEYLADELEARRWSRADFARRIGWSVEEVNLLIDASKRVDAEIARKLAGVLGTSIELWLNLQASWDEYRGANSRARIAEMKNLPAEADATMRAGR